MKKRYTQPTACMIEITVGDILLTSAANALTLDEETADESRLTRFLWNDMQED